MKRRDAKRYAYGMAAEILQRNLETGVVQEDVVDVETSGYGPREVKLVEAAFAEVIEGLRDREARLWPVGSKGAAAYERRRGYR